MRQNRLENIEEEIERDRRREHSIRLYGNLKFNKSAEPIPSSSCNFQVGNNSIGRGADNAVCINDEKISTKHADLTITPEGQYILTDLGSSNGTFVNGQRITQCGLNGGDQIMMGDTTIIV